MFSENVFFWPNQGCNFSLWIVGISNIASWIIGISIRALCNSESGRGLGGVLEELWALGCDLGDLGLEGQLSIVKMQTW